MSRSAPPPPPGETNRTGVFLCHCGTNISDTVEMSELAEHARSLSDVAVVRESRFLCAESGQRLIQQDITERSLTGAG